MKKIVSLILAVMMIIGCCSALATDVPTIEARSNTLTITVNAYALTADDPTDTVTGQTTGAVITAKIDELSKQVKETDKVTWTVTVDDEPITITKTGDHEEGFSISATDIYDLLGSDLAGTYTIDISGSIPTSSGTPETVTGTVTVSAVKTSDPDDDDERKDPTDDPTDPTESALTLKLTADQTSYMVGDTITITVTPTIAEAAKKFVDADSLTYTAYAQENGKEISVSVNADTKIVFTGKVSGTYLVWAYAEAEVVLPTKD